MIQSPHLIILAGGSSSRMVPIQQKQLLRFGMEPLLVSQIRRLYALGFSQMTIVASQDNHAEIGALTSNLHGIEIQIAIQDESKGMGDAILKALPLLHDPQNTPIFITQIHDVVDDELYIDMLNAFRADPTAAYAAGYEREDYFPGGYFIVNPEGRLTGIVEKPGANNRPSNLVNIVAHIYPNAAQLADALDTTYNHENPTDDHYEQAMDVLMKTIVFKVVPYRGPWSALKYPWHILDVMNYFLNKIKGQNIAESAYISKTAAIVGDVYIGERVKIFPGAAVVGPAYIGADTVIGNNALVRNSMVLNHCEVGFTTEVARSYVADNCSMHACRVLDSVFASGVNFSAGCTTANLRIDRSNVPSVVKGQKVDSGRDKLGAIIGENAFLGVDVMTMPGIKIGANAKVGPGTHVHHDLKANTRIYVKQEVVIVEPEEK